MRWNRLALLGLTIIGSLAGGLFMVAVFLPAPGEYTEFPLEGSVLETKPGEGIFLILAGLALMVALVLTFRSNQPIWALLAAGLVIVAGLSLDLVTYHYSDRVIERSRSLWEMRGDGAVAAAIAASVGFVAAVGCAAAASRTPKA